MAREEGEGDLAQRARRLFWSADLQGQKVLVDRAGGKVLVLNPAASLCWRVLVSGEPVQAAARQISSVFSIGAEQAQRDAEAFWKSAQTLLSVDAETVVAVSIRPDLGSPVASYTIALGGRTFHLLCATPVLSEVIESLFAPLIAVSSTSPNVTITLGEDENGLFLITSDGKNQREKTADRLLGQLISEITDRAYPNAKWASVMHAGAVAWDAGAIAIVAPSGRGKSLLVAGLVDAGYSYVSDDSAPIDAVTGQIMPVPLALVVKQSGLAALRTRYPQLENATMKAFIGGPRRFLGLKDRSAVAGAPLRAFVLPSFSPAAKPEVEPVEPLDTLSALIGAGCWISPEEEIGTRFFELLSSRPAYRISYRSLDEGVALVSRVVAGLT